MEIVGCNEEDYETLAGIWERSVRATHTFLPEEDIIDIKSALATEYFPHVDLYGVLSEEGAIAGFMGISGTKLEMLFIDDCMRGRGLGTRLVESAAMGVSSVDVNEQNEAALGFYLAKGFHMVSRDEYDSEGRPFPILHLALQ